MSPLAPILLTFATLMVSSKAQQNNNCAAATFGHATPTSINFAIATFPHGGGIVTIPDECPNRYQKAAVGNWVVACNGDPNGVAPILTLLDQNSIQPVKITCPDQCPLGAQLQ